MIGIDTNLLVRFLMDDDPGQSILAKRFFASLGADNQGYVSLVVVVETIWVLQKSYKTPRSLIAESIEALLDSQELAFQDSPSVYFAVQAYKKGEDFADALAFHSAKQAGCETTMTFDKKAASNLGMKLLT